MLREFEDTVGDEGFLYKLELMHNALGPITKATHHVETCGAKASWVFPLCMACVITLQKWAQDRGVVRNFSEATRKQVLDVFVARWEGSGQLQVGLKKDAHILAYFLDPYTVPTAAAAPQGWQVNCREALSQFYYGAELEKAMDELDAVVARTGSWGDVIKRKQAMLASLITEKEEAAFKNDVDRVIFMQKNMGSSVGAWTSTGIIQHPLLGPVAIRLGNVAVQSGDVERVCKAHKVIHTKSRNRLLTKTVHMLLFTYVNLRLLNKCTKELGDFLSQALEGCVEDEVTSASAIISGTDMNVEFDCDPSAEELIDLTAE
jgi:hypothetical protein